MRSPAQVAAFARTRQRRLDQLAAVRASPTKTCTRCGVEQPRDDAHFCKTGKPNSPLSPECRQCRNGELRGKQRERHERQRRKGNTLRQAERKRERHAVRQKLRRAVTGNLGYERSRDMQPYQRKARRFFPDDRRCHCKKCQTRTRSGLRKRGIKTKLWYPFGPLTYWVAERLCGRCYGDRLSVLMRAHHDHQGVLCKTPEERVDWQARHEERLERKRIWDLEFAVVRIKLDYAVRCGEITHEAALDRLKKWELYDAPELCA